MRNYRDIGKANNLIAWGGGKSQSIEGCIGEDFIILDIRLVTIIFMEV